MPSWIRRHGGRVAALLLVGSLGLNAALMLRYRVPPRLFGATRAEEPASPRIRFDAALPEPDAPRLAFARRDAAADVTTWAREARERLQACLGATLAHEPPKVREVRREAVGAVTRVTLVVTQWDGLEVPAFLFLPRSATPRPALVVLPAYSQGIVGTAGIHEDFQNAMALRLAEAGYVTMTPEVRGLGYLRLVGTPDHDMNLGSYIGYCVTFGRSLPGVLVSDAATCLDHLVTLPEVDADSLGAVGFSLGGKTAIYLAALDARVKATVASGCVMSFRANFGFAGHGPEDAVPGLGTWLDLGDCLGLVAPRAALVHWGAEDSDRASRCASWNDSSLPTFEAAQAIYAAAGAAERLEKSVTPGLAHAFDNEAALAFLRRRLPVSAE